MAKPDNNNVNANVLLLTAPYKGFSGSTGSTESDRMHVKAPTAAAIWSMCDLWAQQTQPDVIEWESILRREENRSTQKKPSEPDWDHPKLTPHATSGLNLSLGGGRPGW